MAYSQTWLEDQTAVRGILVEVTVYDVIAAQDVVKYLSNIGYMTTDGVTSYLPIISGGVQFTESISIDNSASLSYGDIQVSNPNGLYDSWLDNTKYIWANRSIKVYLGDPFWVCNTITNVHRDFQLIFNGIVADIDSNAYDTLNIKIRDKMERLNDPVSDTKLGTYGTWIGGQSNQESLLPIVFGEVFNMEPLLINPSTLEYMYNNGITNDVIEVRDNGVPIYMSGESTATTTVTATGTNNVITVSDASTFLIGQRIKFTGTTFGGIVAGITYYISNKVDSTHVSISTTLGGNTYQLSAATGTSTSSCTMEHLQQVIVNNTTGKFNLTNALSGVCTMSVQGVKNSINLSNNATLISGTYTDNIANIITLIVTQYGNSSRRLTVSDLDLSNLSVFAGANNAKVGVVLKDRDNLINVCNNIARSIGAQLYFNRLGLLQLLRLGISTADSSVNITDRDILHHSLTISSRTEVVASTALGYCRNYTIQSSLLTAIPAAHKDIFATEWIVAKATNESTKLNYKLDVTPVQKDTCLIATADAQAEADRLNTYFSQPRTVYKFTGISKLLSLKLGQSVQMVNSRYNLYNSGDGKTGQVISLTPNWLESTIEVEVIV